MNNNVTNKEIIEYPYLEKPLSVYTLENGHKVVFAYKKSPMINVSSWVKTGSINENKENNGISHFVEHLLFKGTTKYPAGVFDRTMEEWYSTKRNPSKTLGNKKKVILWNYRQKEDMDLEPL